MIATLNSYLVQHKSISIPGLGTIYVERIPAHSDFVNRQILPPSYHYRFDKYTDTPDKDFFTYLAEHHSIADYEAIRLFNDWANNFRNSIRQHELIEWAEIGTFTKDASGDIVFEPTSAAGSYLKPVPAERVLRSNARHTMIVGDKQITNVEMTEYLSEDVRPHRRRWWVLALIAGLITLAAVFYHFYRNGFNLEATANQQHISTP